MLVWPGCYLCFTCRCMTLLIRNISFIIMVCSFLHLSFPAIGHILAHPQFHPDTELLVCPSVSVNTYKNNLLHNLGPWAESCRLFSDLCLFLRACLWMFVCFRRKNRCSCSFRIGFLILATKRPVIYVIVLLPWPKQYLKRDEGGRGTDGRPLDRRKCWLLVHSLITVGKHYHCKCGIITISMLEWIILIISKFAIPK